MRAARPSISIASLTVSLFFCLFASAQSIPTPASADASHPGRAVYERTCGGCHNNPENSRAPSLATLRMLNRTTVQYAIDIGYMKMQAKDLKAQERTQLLDWLALNQSNPNAWLGTAQCKGKVANVDVAAKQIATTFGLGNRNLRQQSAAQSGLKANDFAKLELAWAFAIPQTPTMRSQPVVVGTTIFVASTDAGRVFALDTQSGCVKWQYESAQPLRSSLSYGEIATGKNTKSQAVIVAGDATGGVVAIDAKTGKLLWRTDVRLDESNRITGTPVIHKNRIYAPLSSVEISHTRLDSYECCKAHGAVVALDLQSGKLIWTGHTMPTATKQKINRAGAQLWGPSGAPIWSTPAIDEKRNVLYVGTGENNSLPATDTSDSIMAFDLDTGERKWVFQATKKDIWNYACRNGANCDFGDQAIIVDHDFGGSVMIVKRKDGRDLLVVGQKSGTTWALDPDNNGALVWSQKIGSGGANGGIHWGTATDGSRVFVSINDRIASMNDRAGDRPPPPSTFVRDPTPGKPGLFALDLETGKILWERKSEGDCTGDRKQRFATCDSRIGYSPAPLVVDGAVVQGAIDGILRVFDGATGKTLWSYDTMRKFDTVNGVAGNGGSIDSSPYVAANGTLFVVSGYARFGESPGNVLLAFRPKR